MNEPETVNGLSRVRPDLLESAKSTRRVARAALTAYERAPTPATTKAMTDAVVRAEHACSDLVTLEPERWHEYVEWAFTEDN